MRRNYSRVIDELRTDYGLNLVAIGQRIGIDPRTVGKWWQGKHKPNQDSRKKLNKLYREVKGDNMAQVSIFEAVNDNTRQIMQVISTADFHGERLDFYGDMKEPLFRAGEVAKLIDYSTASLSKFLEMVDDDEKDKKNVLTPGGVQKVWFLTEQGLYEVLFQSRKPKAKEFKKWIKQVLKEIRLNGYYLAGELVEPAPETAEKAPSTLAEAERFYIDTLAKSIAEAQDMAEKRRLADKLARFMQ